MYREPNEASDLKQNKLKIKKWENHDSLIFQNEGISFLKR